MGVDIATIKTKMLVSSSESKLKHKIETFKKRNKVLDVEFDNTISYYGSGYETIYKAVIRYEE